MKDSTVGFKNSQGGYVEAVLLHLRRHEVVIEIHSAGVVLQMSEMLRDFSIRIEDFPVRHHFKA